ncbi:MAG TPA: cupredoxin domain-containing protein [Acidimicrobiia bacterium]|nr:cupredoxin domain-containing protein [Acidimicrobiia bacterium]
MLSSESKAEVLVANEASHRGPRWRRLLNWTGWAGALGFGMVALFLGDIEAAAVAVAYLISTLLLRLRGGRLGAVGISLVSLVTLFFMGAAALTNAQVGSQIQWVLVTAGLAAIAFTGVIAAANDLFRPADGSARSTGPSITIGLALLWLVGVTTWALVSGNREVPDATTSLVAENVAFSDDVLVVSSGEIMVEVANRDLFWHTFTVEDLGVDLRVPVGAERIVAFDAPPGTYQYICAVPGHPEAGMKGSLIVIDD